MQHQVKGLDGIAVLAVTLQCAGEHFSWLLALLTVLLNNRLSPVEWRRRLESAMNRIQAFLLVRNICKC